MYAPRKHFGTTANSMPRRLLDSCFQRLSDPANACVPGYLDALLSSRQGESATRCLNALLDLTAQRPDASATRCPTMPRRLDASQYLDDSMAQQVDASGARMPRRLDASATRWLGDSMAQRIYAWATRCCGNSMPWRLDASGARCLGGFVQPILPQLADTMPRCPDVPTKWHSRLHASTTW